MEGFLNVLDEFLRKSLAEEEFALGDLLNAFGQILGCAPLNNIAADARFQGLDNVVVIAVYGQDNCSRPGNGLVNAAGSFDSVKTGHRKIKEDDVWFMFVGERDSLLSVGGLNNHLESFPFKKSLQAPTNWRVVVCQQDSQRR